MQHFSREEREGGAEKGAGDEQGGECARGVVAVVLVVVVVMIAISGVGLEDVAGERGAVFVDPVAGEDEGECGSGPREDLDV